MKKTVAHLVLLRLVEDAADHLVLLLLLAVSMMLLIVLRHWEPMWLLLLLTSRHWRIRRLL